MSGIGSRGAGPGTASRLPVLILSALFIFLLCGWTSENVRVAVTADLPVVTVQSAEGLRMAGAAAVKKAVFRSADAGKYPVRISAGGTFIKVNGKSYRGTIEIRKKPNGRLQVVNELDIEDYLKGVIASEIPHDWEYEALKAQAVASRTYALYQKRTSGSRPYHVLATVNGQVYNGRSAERETAIRAVRETQGIVITYKGEIIPAFYHSSCGGHTENAFELWGIDEPYLQGVDCECQQISPYGSWERRFTSRQVAAALGKQGYRLNNIRDVAIEGITPAGRVKQVAIRDAKGVTSIPAEKFRSAIGYSSIPSVFFEAEMAGEEIVISGRGLGHGVGLCQWGAREMAQRGFDYAQILRYYYPGTSLEKTRPNKKETPGE